MLLKAFFLLVSLGQAARILRGNTPHTATSSDSSIIRVNGTLTSVSVLEDNGCPAGTYHVQPFEAGKSLNTYVDFDAGSFFFNSTTSPGPANCTLSIDYEFVYPEDGNAEVIFDTIMHHEDKFEEGDVDRGTNFVMEYDILFTAEAEQIAGVLSIIKVEEDGPDENQVGAGLNPIGAPGEVAVGTFQTKFSIYTAFGPGEISVTRIAVGFGLYEST